MLTSETYTPDGMTALYDAIGMTIRRIEDRLAALPVETRPTKVIVAIVTDGKENASVTFRMSTVREMIQAKTAAGWAFIFIGADQDAYTESSRIGIPKSMTLNVSATAGGTAQTYRCMGNAVSMYCSTGKVSSQWTDDTALRSGQMFVGTRQ
ncbi:MAG: hypothetical protein PHR28_12985 [candidate division Zixibacteria bacterium]|nr:hypothetical protein [candidate division Zixibacteria bacterium]